MTARSRHRGHSITWTGGKWEYTEQHGPQILLDPRERICMCCGNLSDGLDYCLGSLPLVRAACCGHGHPEDAYFIFHNSVEVRGEEAIRLQRCWINHCVTPGDVIEMYLRVLNVEDVYRLCRLCSTGAITLPSAIGVLNTFCRNPLDIAPFCDILEVYSKRNNQETHMNTKAITNIQRQTSILSDGHQQVADQAVATTAAIIALDARQKDGGGVGMYTRQVRQHLDGLQEQLAAQSERALRVRDEIEQIKKSLKIV